jgi:hypothetical protein
VSEKFGVVKNVTRQNENRDERLAWYWPEIELPNDLGVIDNPVFAAKLGGMVNDTAFQKKRDCAKRVFGGGVKGAFSDECTTTMETGRNKIENTGNIVSYYGNTSLRVSSEGSIAVGGNILASDSYNNYKPEGWEGFRDYDFPYQGRTAGVKFNANDTYTVLLADELLKFTLDRFIPEEGISSANIRYPTKISYFDNETVTSRADLITYTVEENDWLEAAALSADT